QGRTVLFVSHNLPGVQSLCSSAVLLQSGQVITHGPVADVVREFLRLAEGESSRDLSTRSDRKGLGATRVVRVEVRDGDHEGGLLTMGRPARIVFHLSQSLPGLSCVFTIIDQHGYSLAKFNSRLFNSKDGRLKAAEDSLTCLIDEWPLAPGRYRLDVII